jgi:acyl phosphate:glycerol-3-phosphate acyltransferase
MVISIAGCLVISYLIGSLPFGLWIGLLKGVDIRTLGSKNIGTTNVLRILGVGPGILVFVLDTAKGMAGIYLAEWRVVPFHFVIVIGLAAILGHSFSPVLRFKGGKGVATSLGVLIGLTWPVALLTFLLWGIITLVTRYVSLASITAAVSLPILVLLLEHTEKRTPLLLVVCVIAALVIIKHRSNIARLLAGTEAKIGKRVLLVADSSEKEVP